MVNSHNKLGTNLISIYKTEILFAIKKQGFLSHLARKINLFYNCRVKILCITEQSRILKNAWRRIEKIV